MASNFKSTSTDLDDIFILRSDTIFDGSIVCGYVWGIGQTSRGQLGLGDSANRSSPTKMGSSMAWNDISASRYSSLGLRLDGTLWGWGRNSNGQLGIINNILDIPTPVQVGSLTTWKLISSGYYSSLATQTDGTLWAFGSNSSGLSGLNDAVFSRSSPTKVGTGATWNLISMGRLHALATQTDGTLWSWGFGGYGQLGTNTVYSRSSPTKVGTASWTLISAGDYHSLGVQSTGSLWSWGYDFSGQLGQGTLIHRSNPTQIGALTTWRSINAGYGFSLATQTDGTLWTWGYNAAGLLGLGDVINRSSPTKVGAATTWNLINGYNHVLAVQTTGSLWAWGGGANGKLGVLTTIKRSSPIQVGTDTTWFLVATGEYHSLALKTVY